MPSYADERCDECSGTRWPVSAHERHCSLYGVNEGERAYARVEWLPADVQTLRPDMSDDDAGAFLIDNERNIQERMTERGWEAIETLLDMADFDARANAKAEREARLDRIATVYPEAAAEAREAGNCGACGHLAHWRECRAPGCYCRHRGPHGDAPKEATE